MTRLAALALILAAAPLLAQAALAQTMGPTPGQIVSQTQANLNRFQLELQAEQLQRLQQQNLFVLQQPDPAVQAQALARQQQIQQQIDQTMTLQQQALRPGTDPAEVQGRLQRNGARIQQLQQQPPVLPAR